MGELDASQVVQVEVPAFSVGASSMADTDLFNTCVPHLKIVAGNSPDQFIVRSSTKRVLGTGASARLLADAEASLKAFDSAFQFLTALAISTQVLVLWRRATIEPKALKGNQLERGEALQVVLAENPLAVGNPKEIHAGHLAVALQLVGVFTQERWSPRFQMTYQKAQLFLATPVLAAVDFFEDAYLGFFRCLEYVTMARVLGGCRGTFDEKRLAEALGEVDVKIDGSSDPQKAREVGRRLIRRRGQAVAHLGSVGADHSLSAQEVFELKGLTDLLTIAWLNNPEARRERMKSQTGS